MALPTRRRHAAPRVRAALGALAVTAMLLGGTTLPAAAEPAPPAPSQGDVDAARQQVAAVATSVAAMDVRLAELSTAQEAAHIALQGAAEAYNQAVVDHQAAVVAAGDAATRSDAANARAEVSRVLLVGLARDSSRSGGGLDQLGMYLTSTGVEDAISTTDAMTLVSSKADKAGQQYQADSVVAATLQSFADAAVADQAAKKTAADDALLATQDAQTVAERAVADAAAERQTLLVQLAEARSTSVEVETARQAGLEAERAARAEAEARARIAAQTAVPARQTVVQPANPTPPSPVLPTPSSPVPPVVAPPVTPAPVAPPVTAPPVVAPPVVTPPPVAPPVVAPPVAPAPVAPPVVAPPVVAPPVVAPPSGGLLGTGTSRGSAAQGQAAVAWATSKVGVPYGYGGTGPGSYDCSGLTGGAWRAAGVNINRTSRDQYKQALKVSLNSLRPGDLVFWGNNPNDANSITHVAMYAGGNMMVEASRPGVPVRVTPMRWDSRLMPYGGRP